MIIPKGWRELEPGEKPRKGDKYRFCGKWKLEDVNCIVGYRPIYDCFYICRRRPRAGRRKKA